MSKAQQNTMTAKLIHTRENEKKNVYIFSNKWKTYSYTNKQRHCVRVRVNNIPKKNK